MTAAELLALAGVVERPRRRPMAVPREVRVLDQRLSDWLLIAAVFPGALGVFSGLVFVCSRLGLGMWQ